MREIFWGDYKFDEEDALDMIQSGSWREKRFIFHKILQNSSNLLKDLSYFDRNDLKKLLYEYKVPNFNRAYLQKRLDIAKNYFFDEKVHIKELAWK